VGAGISQGAFMAGEACRAQPVPIQHFFTASSILTLLFYHKISEMKTGKKKVASRVKKFPA
jgi:hypothetical protein